MSKWSDSVRRYQARPSIYIDWRLLCFPSSTTADPLVVAFLKAHASVLRFVVVHHVAEYSIVKGLLFREPLPIVDRAAYTDRVALNNCAASVLPSPVILGRESAELYSMTEEPNAYYLYDNQSAALEFMSKLMAYEPVEQPTTLSDE